MPIEKEGNLRWLSVWDENKKQKTRTQKTCDAATFVLVIKGINLVFLIHIFLRPPLKVTIINSPFEHKKDYVTSSVTFVTKEHSP